MGKSRPYCCVVGCKNLMENTQFYSFPRVSPLFSWRSEKRQKWIQAVREYNYREPNWEPSHRALICSQHFVNNRKSEHPLNPSYVPSIFPDVTSAEQRWVIKRRRHSKKKFKLEEQPVEFVAIKGEPLDLKSIDMGVDPMSKMIANDCSCQTEALEGHEPFNYFMCNLFVENGRNCASVQVSLTFLRNEDVKNGICKELNK